MNFLWTVTLDVIRKVTLRCDQSQGASVERGELKLFQDTKQSAWKHGTLNLSDRLEQEGSRHAIVDVEFTQYYRESLSNLKIPCCERDPAVRARIKEEILRINKLRDDNDVGGAQKVDRNVNTKKTN